MLGMRSRCCHRSRATRRQPRNAHVAADHPRWTEARRVDRPREDNRTGCPDRADPKVHATRSDRPEQTRGRLCTVRDARIGSRDEDPLGAHADDVRTPKGPSTVTLAPSSPRRSPRRGVAPCASALASGAPEGCARTPRSRSSTAPDARPRESME